ncbi:ankyrin repeat protein, partial [Baffinella frigidus]
TPLRDAALLGRGAIVRMLLYWGADARVPLLNAIFRGHEALLQTLLDHGADVNLKTRGDWTLMHWAAERSHGAIVQLLLDKGADIRARNKVGETPEDLASARG